MKGQSPKGSLLSGCERFAMLSKALLHGRCPCGQPLLMLEAAGLPAFHCRAKRCPWVAWATARQDDLALVDTVMQMHDPGWHTCPAL